MTEAPYIASLIHRERDRNRFALRQLNIDLAAALDAGDRVGADGIQVLINQVERRRERLDAEAAQLGFPSD